MLFTGTEHFTEQSPEQSPTHAQCFLLLPSANSHSHTGGPCPEHPAWSLGAFSVHVKEEAEPVTYDSRGRSNQ